MEKLISVLPYLTLGVGIWALANGILHDVFVLEKYGREYTKDLLRLLLDGHILIFTGIMQILSWKGLQDGKTWGYPIAIAACVSLLVYCGLIFPFLKSLVTITLNLFLLVLLVIAFLKQN
jgi:hypothetical protein